MLRFTLIFLSNYCFFSFGFSQEKQKDLVWPDGQKIAVSLSYDDALGSQLDNAIPDLDRFGFKASFYLLPNSPTFKDRMTEWRSAAKNGHELGNHSIYHPCRTSLPNREWVAPHHDLDKYSVSQMVEEVTTANAFLTAIDGRNERTYTPPCGDLSAGGQDYITKVQDLFVAIKGQDIASGFSVLWIPNEMSGTDLIELIKNVPDDTSLINIIFHGIGGDYLSVSSEAHSEMLKFLVNNKEFYYVDSYINIMKHVNELRK
ncbi:MAG: polysaccharide deacetylase family protein [Reichenbachiella sp.]